MKKILIFLFCLFITSASSLFACHNGGWNVTNTIDNGDGTYTITYEICIGTTGAIAGTTSIEMSLAGANILSVDCGGFPSYGLFVDNSGGPACDTNDQLTGTTVNTSTTVTYTGTTSTGLFNDGYLATPFPGSVCNGISGSILTQPFGDCPTPPYFGIDTHDPTSGLAATEAICFSTTITVDAYPTSLSSTGIEGGNCDRTYVFPICPVIDYTTPASVCSGDPIDFTVGPGCTGFTGSGTTGTFIDIYYYDNGTTTEAPAGYEGTTFPFGATYPDPFGDGNLTPIVSDGLCVNQQDLGWNNNTCDAFIVSYFAMVFDYDTDADGDGLGDYIMCGVYRYDVTIYPAPPTAEISDSGCGVAPQVEITAADGTICDILTGPSSADGLPCVGPPASGTETVTFAGTYAIADIEALFSAPAGLGCYTDLPYSAVSTCLFQACAATCPTLTATTSPATITNSTCNIVGGMPAGGLIEAPSVACPVGSTLEYSIDNMTWTTTPPAYNQSGPAQTIYTRCLCTLDGTTASPSGSITTAPGVCPPSFLSVTDPCDCTNGVDLNGDGQNDLAQEIITITSATTPSVTAVSNLVDETGAALTLATASALISGAAPTYTLTAYVPADGLTTYSITITDGTNFETITGGPCSACPPAACGASPNMTWEP